jgi:hypothetical protein
MPTDDFAQLSLQFVDHTQWRYEVIRPVVLLADRTPRQRADETDTHPATVRTLTRRFRQQGMVGLLPEDVEVSVRARMPRVPEAVREEVDRLKALYDGFCYRALARILFITCGVSVDHKTVKGAVMGHTSYERALQLVEAVEAVQGPLPSWSPWKFVRRPGHHTILLETAECLNQVHSVLRRAWQQVRACQAFPCLQDPDVTQQQALRITEGHLLASRRDDLTHAYALSTHPALPE